MSVNIKQLDGTLKKVAGSTILLDGTCSEIQNGTITASNIGTINASAAKVITITLPVAFPDADYAIIFPDSTNSALNVTSQNVTATGFEIVFRNILGTDFTASMDCTWYAFRLVELEGYTELQNKVSNPDSTPTENSTNLVTSGGVYDAISSASKIFINSESAWNELDAETKATYQVAILTDKPNVNAVDSTNGSTTVVGEPNKRWIGTQAEWEQLKNSDPDKAAEYELVCFNDDNGASGKDIYSTEEVKTNKVWIDGKPIYRKVLVAIRNGAWTPNWVLTSEKRYNNPTDIPNNIDTLVDARAQSLRNNGWYDSITQVQDIGLSINISTQTMWANWPEVVSKADVIIEYTKTTD